jgi:PilZ domain
MEKAIGMVPAPLPTGKKTAARAALVDLKEPVRAMLADCFRQFGIETVVMPATAAERLQKEKFEACVLKLGPAAQPMMEAARTSLSNSRMIIYGLGGSAQDAMRFSKYGINAVFQEPLERHAALKLVRATQMLVLHELRRYVRIPVITEITVIPASDSRRLTATSVEVSSGGMSMRSAEDISPGQSVEISFALLTLPRVWVRGSVSWRNAPGKTFGIRFDPQDERRQKIKDWIDSYVESS